MKRQSRTNVMLLAMVLLLFAAVLAEIKREEWAHRQVLARADLTTVHDVAVRCGGCRTRRFEKVQGHWWMREPYAVAANDIAVIKLTSIVGAPVRKRHAATEFDPKRLGLEPAEATLQLGDLRIDFGTTDAINGDRYVRVHDEINLVPDRFSVWLYATAESEVDPHLVPPTAKAVAVSLRGDAERTDLADAWQRATAREVVRADQAPAAPGSETPATLRLDNGDVLHVVIGQRGDKLAVTRGDLPLTYLFDAAVGATLTGATVAKSP